MSKPTNNESKQVYFKAKEKVNHVKIFYVHLVGYLIAVGLMGYNIYYIHIYTSKYTNFFTWFNSIFIVAWTVFIVLHWRWAIKGKTFFSKGWEAKKAKKYIEKQSTKEETTMWE